VYFFGLLGSTPASGAYAGAGSAEPRSLSLVSDLSFFGFLCLLVDANHYKIGSENFSQIAKKLLEVANFSKMRNYECQMLGRNGVNLEKLVFSV
jgi:hypothetical protein